MLGLSAEQLRTSRSRRPTVQQGVSPRLPTRLGRTPEREQATHPVLVEAGQRLPGLRS